MRAARLLHLLLILQNRGRQTSAALAAELEVSARTILRDVDAMSEAGLPIIVRQGHCGGIELGFNYRTRLTGLTAAEAEALGVVLSADHREVAALGLEVPARMAVSKLLESLPGPVRGRVEAARRRFGAEPPPPVEVDPRVPALADAVRRRGVVTLRCRSAGPQTVHPVALRLSGRGWALHDALSGCPVAQDDWGDINLSARTFADED